MLAIPDVLTSDEVARVRGIIDAGDWNDGNATSGPQSALAKRNRQLAEGSDAAVAAGRIVLDAIGRAPMFVAAALPSKVFPPLFNRYEGGEAFGTHIDNAIRHLKGQDFRIRSDLSATLFLSDDYDGGELEVEGRDPVRLPAGHMLLYSASTLHRVAPVTRGVRLASFFWVQSLVRSDADRQILFDLDRGIQGLATARGQDDPEIIRLTGVYHNLLRRWAEL